MKVFLGERRNSMDLNVIYEDSDMLVVDKPAGMIVNKADTAKGLITLQDLIDSNYSFSKTDFSRSDEFIVDGYNKLDEFKNRSGIVHRLDKETSGIILIAKNPTTFINLQNQFKSKIVSKTYTTLVHGKLEKKTGEIIAPIGRLPWNRMRFGIFPEGRPAHTNYRVLKELTLASGKSKEAFSLVEVYPQTGRTHQIRVHFQYIKHPVFGDELYAGRKTGRDDRKHVDRHFLHASKISLLHPVANAPVEFESTLPIELSDFLEKLTEESIA